MAKQTKGEVTEDEDDQLQDKPEDEVPGRKKKADTELSGDEHDVEVEPEGDDEGGPQDKQGRRGARYRELEERMRLAEERASRYEQELSAARQRMDIEAAQRATPKVEDDYDGRIKTLQDARASKLSLIRKAVGDDEALGVLARESMDLERQIQEVIVERAVKKQVPAQSAPQVSVQRQMLEAEFPQVYRDPRVLAYAQGEFLRQVARGETESIETARKANSTALRDFGLATRSAPPPTAAQQMRYSGTPASNGNGQTTGDKVKFTGALRRLARARSAVLSPNDDDDVAEKKLAKRMRKAGIV